MITLQLEDVPKYCFPSLYFNLTNIMHLVFDFNSKAAHYK